MVADVTSLVRVLAADDNHNHRTASNESNTQKPTAMITRDLFHASSNSALQSQELDLDLHVPAGWEKRLDLQSGKVYIQKCKNSLISSERKLHMNSSDPKLQDLNFPPSPISKRRRPLNLFDDTSLDLKLMSSSSSSSSTSSSLLPSSNNSNYTSVCTLDKVKFALERAEKKDPNPPINNNNIKKLRTTSSFWMPSNTTLSSSSPSYSSSSSSIRESEESEEKLFSSLSSSSPSSSSPLAVGCPGCLSYVLIMKNNPKCPRCKSIVPFPLMKKPRIDLNISI